VELPGVVLLPGLARYSCSVQADRYRDSLGTDSALLIMVVFTVVFGKLAKLPSEEVPYPILVFAAILPWQFLQMLFQNQATV